MGPRTIPAAAIGVAALVSAMLAQSTAIAGLQSPTVSLAASHDDELVGRVHTADRNSLLTGKCGTKFGTELPTVDGILSWNDQSGNGWDTGGAADFYCATAVRIKKVLVYGYMGAPTEHFNVIVFAHDPTNTSIEPNDNPVTCSYTNLAGAAGGVYPDRKLTKLTFPTAPRCDLIAGQWWISVQSSNASEPWYWEMQNAQAGQGKPDWVDRHDLAGSGCTTFANGRTLIDCLGYNYPDWMLKLR